MTIDPGQDLIFMLSDVVIVKILVARLNLLYYFSQLLHVLVSLNILFLIYLVYLFLSLSIILSVIESSVSLLTLEVICCSVVLPFLL
jgi:hypothetical protein